jgi:two-component system OmpR family sensor kinase
MRRLRRRIWLHLLVVLFVGIVASGIVFTSGWRASFQHSAVPRLARHLASQLADDWGNRASFAHEVKRLSEDLEIELTVRSAEPDGELIASAGPPLPRLEPGDVMRVRKNDVVVERGPRFFVAAPLIVDGRVVAVVESSTMRSLRAPGLMRPLITIALIVLIAGVASGPLARRISLPIERMTDAMRRFGAGDLSARVPELGRGWRSRWERHVNRVRHHHRRGKFADDEMAQLTRAFNEMAERLEHLVRGQKELLANVSHELRSPLARIRVALELLPRDGKSDARLRDVEADLIELERLIDDVLTTSRLDATGLPTHVARVTVTEILAALAARAEHDPVTAGKPVRVRGDAGVSVMADGALLKRALWNLIENAAKYGAPPIELAAGVEDAALVLSVTDHGAGIAADERARVFEPFYRSDKARTPGRGGFGLGLTLARRVAEVHGGSISAGPASVDDGVERGTRVTMRIPMSEHAATRARG